MTTAFLPPRLLNALQQQTRLNQQGIYFLPIRHHSPACAFATLHALQALQPSHILIEAPSSFQPLLADLQHPDSQPPLAILGQTQLPISPSKNDSNTENSDTLYRSAYFPFCDYSPEWVALRYGNTLNADIRFIDLPWAMQALHEQQQEQPQDSEQTWQAHSLQQERYLAHSEYLKALAQKLHCRNHDEVWEHLFELSGQAVWQDWHNFFDDILAWCAMSRLDYEPEVLATEGSLVREASMLEHIVQCLASRKTGQNLCILTGGFHTLALIEQLGEFVAEQSQQPKNPKQQPLVQQHWQQLLKSVQTANSKDEAWLIRYSFDRLDRLNGYASGMPSPAFYQACWQDMLATLDFYPNTKPIDNNPPPTKPTTEATKEIINRQRLAIGILSDFSAQLRERQIAQSSFISVKNASEQAILLSQLREHRLIGRFDIMDACQSSFIKGSDNDGQQAFWQTLHELLGGNALGNIVASDKTPPLLAQVYHLAKTYRFKLEDTLPKRTKLDVLRNKKHRLRSQFLHLLQFLSVGFAKKISGADFLQGGSLSLLFEEWEYAWTPMVEARLIELSETGADIYAVAVARLLAIKAEFYQQGQGQSAKSAVQLLVQASLMGLHRQSSSLFAEVEQFLPNDPELASVIGCGQQLVYLWTGRAFLDVARHTSEQALLNLMAKVVPTALFLLEQRQTPNDDQVHATLDSVLALHSFIKQLSPILQDNDGRLLADFYQSLQRLLVSWQAIDLLVGAVTALQFADGKLSETELTALLSQHFGLGVEPERAVNYLSGMMTSVPALFLRYPSLGEWLNNLVKSWQPETFIALLPDLRLAFTRLKPMETDKFAEQIAKLNGVSNTDVVSHAMSVNESQLYEGIALNQKIHEFVNEQGLADWLMPSFAPA